MIDACGVFGGGSLAAMSMTDRSRSEAELGSTTAPVETSRRESARTAFELYESKLAVPLARPGAVRWSPLIRRLVRADEPVIVVQAPAGYGKTTLLRQWAERDPRPFAWVSLDPGDADPVTLLTYVAAALDRSEPVDGSVFDALRAPGRSIWASAVPRVGAALASRDEPVVIVLDDLHRVDGRASLDVIDLLAAHVPPGSSLVLASRTEPALALARGRAEGRLLEIAADDLRFDEAAAARLLRRAGLELADADVAELTRITEGWPAGVYLAALSIRSGALPADALRVTGADRFLGDYFRDELLSRLSEDEAEFLAATSVLGRMCGPLCDAVCAREGSAMMLESLERSNLFLVPLDHERKWYRYHHLFRDLLRAELARRRPRRIRALNRRASVWCADNGELEEAIRYAREAGDRNGSPTWSSLRRSPPTTAVASRRSTAG